MSDVTAIRECPRCHHHWRTCGRRPGIARPRLRGAGPTGPLPYAPDHPPTNRRLPPKGLAPGELTIDRLRCSPRNRVCQPENARPTPSRSDQSGPQSPGRRPFPFKRSGRPHPAAPDDSLAHEYNRGGGQKAADERVKAQRRAARDLRQQELAAATGPRLSPSRLRHTCPVGLGGRRGSSGPSSQVRVSSSGGSRHASDAWSPPTERVGKQCPVRE